MKKLILCIIIFSFSKTFACLNGETRELKDGTFLYQDYDGLVPNGHYFNSKYKLEETLVSLETYYKTTKDLDYLSDKGYVLIILKRYQEAIDLYKRIEAIQPNRYSTASNLGTVYELTGNNAEALKWIEKALDINPDSHHSSEWIHANILKAKLKGEKFHTSDFMLGVNFGNETAPNTKISKRELHNLRQSLYYQLNERISFVEPKEKIVAKLLFELGNIAYLLGDKGEAYDDYKLAEEYGYQDRLLDKRMELSAIPVTKTIEGKVIKEIKLQTRPSNHSSLVETVISFIALIFSGLIIFIFRRKIFSNLFQNNASY